MNKLKLALLIFIFPLCGQAYEVLIPNESFFELKKFQVSTQGLSESFVRGFPLRVHQDILRGEKNFLKSLDGKCRDSIKVTFASPVLESNDAVEASFQDGLVKIEASKCYENADPEDLIEISANPEFKLRAFSTLKDITSERAQDCEWTSAPTIGKSHYCYLNFDLEKSDQVRAQVNFLTFNDESPEFEAPVYFREALVSAHRMGSQTLYYVNSYVRSTQLSSLKKIFAEKYIQTSQSRVFQELEKTLRQKKVNP